MNEHNLLLVHGGAPTAVMNASVYGVIKEAKKHPEISHIYAAMGGAGAILKERFRDLREIPDDKLELLPGTPASVIGSSRDQLEEPEYEAIARTIQKYRIRYVLFNGGNGSMDTCGKIYQVCKNAGTEVLVGGIPKTIDNDLAITDHAPGYPSAARYLASTVANIAEDVHALPIHVSVIEAMGRNAGWITAASILARNKGYGPDLIYLPERPFYENEFLEDVQKCIDRNRCAVVVCSEGLRKEDGSPIVDPIFTVGRSVYYGDVSAHLANLVIKKLGYKARSEKPGIAGRAGIEYQSSVDREEAILAGQMAVRAVTEGHTGFMVGFQRADGERYHVNTILIPIERVMMYENHIPDRFINERGNGVVESFAKWLEPLIGDPFQKFFRFG
jgi:6-phosphofructokinase